MSADVIVPNFSAPQSHNRYAYVQNNPLRFVDPSGSTSYEPPITNPKFRIIERDEWGALDVDFNSGEGRYDPVSNPAGYAYYSELRPEDTLADVLFEVVIHHEGNVQTYDVAEVQREQMGGLSADINYHYVIGPDGSIYEGRDIGSRGAHVLGGNTGRVGILLLGDFHPGTVLKNGTELPIDLNGSDLAPTEQQFISARWLIENIDNAYGINRVIGHRDLNATVCPGDNAMETVRLLNTYLRSRHYQTLRYQLK